MVIATVRTKKKLLLKQKKFLMQNATDTIPVEIAGRVQVLDNGDLLIAAIQTNDAGKYTCIRANEAGSVNGSAYLTVLGNCQNSFGTYYIK